jgi:hypothetical protein
MSISNFLELELLDAVFNNSAYAVATPYISLHTGNPGETGASEAAGGSYARQAGSFGAAAAGQVANDAAISFTAMPASTITHVGIWDAVSGGNFLWGGALTVSRTLSSGATAQFAIGALIVTLD